MNEAIKNRIEQVRCGEVPEGYKRTRAGLTPVSWIREGEIKASALFKNHSNKAHGGAFEVLSATQEKGIIPRSEVEIDIKYDTDNLSSYKKVDVGDFVISLRSFQGGIEFSPYEGLVSPAYTVIKAKRPICVEYYKAYFKTVDFISRLNCTIYGIRDGKQIGFEDFGNLAVHYPPLHEQQKIAEILTCCDQIILLKQQLLDEKRRQKQWLMKKLLDPDSGVRIPGFYGSWTFTILSELISNLQSGTSVNSMDETEEYSKHDSYVLKTSAVSKGQINLSQIKRILYNEVGRAKCALKAKSLIISRMNTPMLVGACAYNRFEVPNIFLPDRLWQALPIDERVIDFEWLNYVLNTSDYQNTIRQTAGGTSNSMKNISKESFLGIPIKLPTIEEQTAIVSTLSAADREIDLLDQELSQWQQKKKSLMQLLLAGIIRVNV